MIKDVRIYPAYNSKGEHALRVKLQTGSNVFFSATIPSGTSKGKNEAKDIEMTRLADIFPKVRQNIIGLDENDWVTADEIIQQTDNSANYSNIGISLALGLSLAIAKASTAGELWKLRGARENFRFPMPLGNVVGGGSHGGSTAWQEFLVLPYKAKSPMEATQINFEFWKVVGEELRKGGWLVGRNIENAWTTNLDELKTLDLLSSLAGDFNVKLGVDFAASSFWNGKTYAYKSLKKNLSPEKQIDAIARVAEVYDLYYLEDPLHEDDFEGFAELTSRLHGRLVVGDDLFCTSRERVDKGIKLKSANAAIIKPNQYGTLYQVSKVIRLMKKSGMVPIVSHRSGETEDDWLSDLALAWDSPIIKIGNLGPDVAKHSRLSELWFDIPNRQMAPLPSWAATASPAGKETDTPASEKRLPKLPERDEEMEEALEDEKWKEFTKEPE
jgi:enolase